MRITKCDKCKAEIAEHDLTYSISLDNFNALIGVYDRCTIDFCKDCKDKFIEWVTGYKPVERKRY